MDNCKEKIDLGHYLDLRVNSGSNLFVHVCGSLVQRDDKESVKNEQYSTVFPCHK